MEIIMKKSDSKSKNKQLDSIAFIFENMEQVTIKADIIDRLDIEFKATAKEIRFKKENYEVEKKYLNRIKHLWLSFKGQTVENLKHNVKINYEDKICDIKIIKEYLLRKDISTIELNYTNGERFTYIVPYKEKDFDNKNNKYVHSKMNTIYLTSMNIIISKNKKMAKLYLEQ